MAFIIHALGNFYGSLQSNVQSITKVPTFTHDDVVQRILYEEELIHNRKDHDAQTMTSALASQACAKTRALCSNCKRPGHLADFCISPGGKMEGKFIDDAKAAQCAALLHASRALFSGQTQPACNTVTSGLDVSLNQ
jgi:hypothetical protein